MLHCRKAHASDHETITRFQLAMALETEKLKLDPEICSRGVRAVFTDSHKGTYYVCERDGRVLGSLLIIVEWSDWRNGTVWWIHSVYTLPDGRGAGVFKALYEHVKGLVNADEGLRGLRLFVDKSNSSAQVVYKKIGMTDEHYSLFEWMKTF